MNLLAGLLVLVIALTFMFGGFSVETNGVKYSVKVIKENVE